MVHVSDRVCIIGAGPAGCCAAYFLKDFCDVTLLDKGLPLRTILPTGGGRCNLAFNEFDFKELATNYPRGEKFLYSIFSRFSTKNTIDLFNHLGIETYVQDDNRIFPKSNSSYDVKEAFLRNLSNVKIIKEKCIDISLIGKEYKVITESKERCFDNIIIAIGGHAGYNILKNFDINIISPKPSLVGLITKENFEILAGVSIDAKWKNINGSILFTHKGISGPLIYKISSLKARENIPYVISLNLYNKEINLQELLNNNPHKQINNVLSGFLPHRVIDFILSSLDVDVTTKCHLINGKVRDLILNKIHNFEIHIDGTLRDGEVVTAGGVNLKDINSKTLESKKYKGLYFVGEVLDIDGFCGGFNLQNCWSTAYVASDSIIKSFLE